MVMSRASVPVIRSERFTFDALKNLMLNSRVLWVPTNAAWTAVVVGSGATEQLVAYNNIYTGATASSTARLYTAVLRHSAGNAAGINFSKRLLFAFTYERIASDAQVEARVQLKAASTAGVLAAGGIGIQVTNLTMVGEGYGSARDVTATLATLTVSQMVDVAIVCDQPNGRIDFYINQVLQGSITAAANIPSGNIGALVIHSIIRGATGTTDSYSQLGNILVATEF